MALCRGNRTQARRLPYIDELLADIHLLFMGGHGGDQLAARGWQAWTQPATRAKVAAWRG